MKLNKATTHALRLLTVCARSGDDLTKVADLAEELEMTQQNTFKIVHLLSRAGLVEGERGRYGGVRLKAPANTMLVGDVVKAMEMLPAHDDENLQDIGQHARMFDHAFEAFVTVLNQTTIADMAQVRRPSGSAGSKRKAKGTKPRKAAKAVKPVKKASRASKTRGYARTTYS